MGPSAATAKIVIADTSPIRCFVEAGAQRAFAAYFGERILITLDVARELEEACVYVPGLLAFLGTWPAAQAPVDLPVELKLKAADILGFVADDPRASLQDLGEVTSILMAQHLRDAGQCQDPLLLVDDQRHVQAAWGQGVARGVLRQVQVAAVR